MASASTPTPDSAAVKTRVPTIKLTGEIQRQYVRSLTAVLRTARLNVHFPDPKRMRSHVEAMGPDVHLGLYPELEIDRRSGLPTYKEWTRVQTDCVLAQKVIDDLGPLERLQAKAAANPKTIYPKQVLKHRYHTALLDRRLAPLGDMDVRLRRVDPATQTGHFNVVLDKLDASGLFVRFTIDLAQHSSVWNRPVVRLTADNARHTEEFRSLIYRFTSFDAEFTFFKLVAFGGLTVERVVKGTVGPVLFAGIPAGGPLGELMAGKREGFVANFAQDMTACDIAQDRDNDPLEDPMADSLSDEARPDYERARGRFGYKVFKDRKFVTSRSLADEIKTFCRNAGTRNIIKTVRTKTDS